MEEKELYKLTLKKPHRYSLLNEIMAIRDNRFPSEKNNNSIYVNGYVGLDVINRYVRYIDELVKYEDIDTITNCKNLQQELQQYKQQIDELIKKYEKEIDYYKEIMKLSKDAKNIQGIVDCNNNITLYTKIVIDLSKLKERDEK